MFSSMILLELAQWCAPFNFSPTVFPQINLKFSFCPRWWFIERSCSSEVVFTFPPLEQLLDTFGQVLIVSFFFSSFFSFFLSFLAINRIILNSASPWVWMHVDVAIVVSLPGLLFTFLWILLLWSVIVVLWVKWTERWRHRSAFSCRKTLIVSTETHFNVVTFSLSVFDCRENPLCLQMNIFP